MYTPWNEFPTPTKSVSSRVLVLTPIALFVAIPAVYVAQVPPAPAPPAILTSMVVPFPLNVFPTPRKFSLSALQIFSPAELMPIQAVVLPRLNALKAPNSRPPPPPAALNNVTVLLSEAV